MTVTLPIPFPGSSVEMGHGMDGRSDSARGWTAMGWLIPYDLRLLIGGSGGLLCYFFWWGGFTLARGRG